MPKDAQIFLIYCYSFIYISDINSKIVQIIGLTFSISLSIECLNLHFNRFSFNIYKALFNNLFK